VGNQLAPPVQKPEMHASSLQTLLTRLTQAICYRMESPARVFQPLCKAVTSFWESEDCFPLLCSKTREWSDAKVKWHKCVMRRTKCECAAA